MKIESINSKTNNEESIYNNAKKSSNFLIELKQNQKNYRHKNLVNGRSPM
jgi:hypothetical protein